MPMGAFISASTFMAIMMELQKQWEDLAADRGIVGCGSKVTIDDVLSMAATRDKDQLLRYFEAVFDILKLIGQQSTSRNANGSKIIANLLESMLEQKDSPGCSKFEAFQTNECPHTRSDVCMLIGVIGFYIYSKHPPSLNWSSHLGERF